MKIFRILASISLMMMAYTAYAVESREIKPAYTDMSSFFMDAPCNFTTGDDAGRAKWLAKFGEDQKKVEGLVGKLKKPAEELGLNPNDRCRINFVTTTIAKVGGLGKFTEEAYQAIYAKVLIKYRDHLKATQPEAFFASLSDEYILKKGEEMKKDASALAKVLNTQREKEIGGTGQGQSMFSYDVIIDNRYRGTEAHK